MSNRTVELHVYCGNERLHRCAHGQICPVSVAQGLGMLPDFGGRSALEPFAAMDVVLWFVATGESKSFDSLANSIAGGVYSSLSAVDTCCLYGVS
jgi:hypothetical protein